MDMKSAFLFRAGANILAGWAEMEKDEEEKAKMIRTMNSMAVKAILHKIRLIGVRCYRNLRDFFRLDFIPSV